MNERSGEFWHPLEDGRVACDLCYRLCEIGEGGAGFCRIRANEGGKLVAKTYGLIPSPERGQSGYQMATDITFRPGLKSLIIGGRSCTAACSFCISQNGALAYGRRVQKGEAPPVELGQPGELVKTTPQGLVDFALRLGAQGLTFAKNEATLDFEFTYAASQLAKKAGLKISISTNGLTTPEAIRKLAPFVDDVTIGIKGSASPEFYRRFMHAEGAIPHVFEAMKAWAEAGVPMVVSDLLAPPQMQSDEEAKDAQEYLYPWIARELGEMTPIFIVPMRRPGTTLEQVESSTDYGSFLLGYGANDETYWHYVARFTEARKRASGAGLLYVLPHQTGPAEVRCHNCGNVLVKVFHRHRAGQHCILPDCLLGISYCMFKWHEQNVTSDSKCGSCGARVPVIAGDSTEMWQWRARELKPFANFLPPRAEVMREQREKFVAPQVKEILPLLLARPEGLTLADVLEHFKGEYSRPEVVHAVYARALAQMQELEMIEPVEGAYHLTARGIQVARGVLDQKG